MSDFMVYDVIKSAVNTPSISFTILGAYIEGSAKENLYKCLRKDDN